MSRSRHARTWLVTVPAGLALTALAAGGAAAVSGSALALPGTAVTLTSVGSDAAPGTAPSDGPAMAENGRYVAFSSFSALRVSAAVPQAGPPPEGGNAQVYVRDETGGRTVLLSDASAGGATAPSSSASGRLVSYDLSEGGTTSIDVADRQATGTGSFDTKPNLAVRQVTGTSRDLPFQRIPDCPGVLDSEGPERTVPCGPRLSADGRTLVYAAQQSPVSPVLTISTVFDEGSARQVPVPQDPVRLASASQGAGNPGNILDIGVFEQGDGGTDAAEVDYANPGSKPLTLSGVSVTGPFSVAPAGSGEPACAGALAPGATCGTEVNFDTASCPEDAPAMETGQLTTGAADPAGQSEITVAAYCLGSPFVSSPAGARSAPGSRPGQPQASVAAARFPRSPARGAVPAAACPAPQAPAAGLPLVEAPGQENDDSGGTLTDFGAAETGEPYVAWMTVTPEEDGEPGDVVARSGDCAIRQVSPDDVKLAGPVPGGLAPACSATLQVGGSGDPDSCTLFVLISPAGPATSAASVSFEFPRGDGLAGDALGFLSVTGVSDVIVARRDASGAGNFARSPSAVVSVNSIGQRIPGASQPSVSASGRAVAFAAPVPVGLFGGQTEGSTEVWLHDTDAAGNQSFQPGSTTLVSCVPGGGTGCTPAADADSPSLSGDGGSVAFAASTAGGSAGQVYARQVAAGRTVLVSATAGGAAGNGASYAPALSQDGSTVAFISQAGNLAGAAVPRDTANLYVRTLIFGAASIELAPGGTSLPAGADTALPAIDAHGQQVSFQTSVRLLPRAPAEVTSVYTFERFPHLVISPATLRFGTLAAGTAPQTRSVTVTDTGPGPAPVTGTAITQPFTLLTDTCAGSVLHAGTSCQMTIQLSPLHAGQDHSTVSLTSDDDAEPVISIGVPVTATVVTPAGPQLIANPAVSIAGQVTQVTGTGFPAGQPVTLSWQPGLGTVTVTASASGTITAPMVIFPEDATGQRALLASNSGGTVLARAKFLVEPPSPEPPFTAPPGPAATSAAP